MKGLNIPNRLIYKDMGIEKHEHITEILKDENISKQWIKKYGAQDFIAELITAKEVEYGLSIGENKSININILNEFNYGNVINIIRERLFI